MPIPRRASVIAITIQKIICFMFLPTMVSQRVPLSTSTRYEACTIQLNRTKYLQQLRRIFIQIPLRYAILRVDFGGGVREIFGRRALDFF